MTDLYRITKIVAAACDWRDTDRAKIGAPAGEKEQARRQHHPNEQKLRAAIDEYQLEKEGNQP
ncbi:MAG: hypothetical protein JO142_21315 [Burkholderiales bacterium]|nr:hypothetical protein [Burkholderiales bacterium]